MGVPVKNISISGRSTIEPGERYSYSISVSPSNATNKAVSWSVSNSSCNAGIEASNDDACIINPGSVSGSFTLNARATDGSGVSTSKRITVSSSTPTPPPDPPKPTTYTYTLQYDKQGGYAGHDGRTWTDDASTIEVMIEPPGPVKNHNKFLGYCRNPNGSGTIYDLGDFIVLSPGTTTLYAIWEPLPYSYDLHYEGNGGGNVPEDRHWEETSSTLEIQIPSPGPYRTGYEFIGWSRSSSGSAPLYDLGDWITLEPGKTVLYATWGKVQTFTLAFDANGGQGGPADQSWTSTKSTLNVQIPITEPTYKEKDFQGWSKSPTGSATYQPLGNIDIGPGTTTLYAVWKGKPVPVRSVSVSGKTSINVLEDVVYSSLVEPSNATNQDVSWHISVNSGNAGITTSNSEACIVKAGSLPGSFRLTATADDGSGASGHIDVVVNAKKNEFRLEFNGQGGTNIPPAQMSEDTKETFIFQIPGGEANTPKKENADFKGWSLKEVPPVNERRYQPGESIEVQKGTTVLYAVWYEYNLIEAHVGDEWVDMTLCVGKSIVKGEVPEIKFNPKVLGGLEVVTGTGKLTKEGKFKIESDYEFVAVITVKPAEIKEIKVLSSPYLDSTGVIKAKASIKPEAAIDKPVSWSIPVGSEFANIKALAVPENGSLAEVYGIKRGKVTIRASSETDPNIFGEYSIDVLGMTFGTVKEPLSSFSEMLVYALGNTYYLKQNSEINLKPTNTAEKKCIISKVTPEGLGPELSTDGGYAGTLKLPGKVLLNVTYWDNTVYEESSHQITIYSVPVEGAVQEISIEGKTTIYTGRSQEYIATALPEKAKNKELSVEVLNGSKYVELSKVSKTPTGVKFSLNGLSPGSATIKVESLDGYGAASRLPVKVVDEPDKPVEPLNRADYEVVSYLDFHYRGKSRRIELPIVSKIEDNHTVSLTEISTVVFGAENRFVMDLGSSKKFSVTIKRINPNNYNDLDEKHPERWSNGKWYNKLKELIDFWQNFGETPNPDNDPEKPFIRTGGFMFHYMPPKLNGDGSKFSMFPEIHEVVFIIGSLNPKFNVQTLTLTLPLQVARMTGRSKKLPTVDISYDSNISGVGGFVRATPKGVPTPMPMPIDGWKKSNNDYAFSHWTTSIADSGTKYYPGQMMTWFVPTKYYAQWELPIDATLIDHKTDSFVIVNIPDAARMAIVYLIGAGGGAGGGCNFFGSAGAGGSGELVVKSFKILPDTPMKIKIGAGGKHGAWVPYVLGSQNSPPDDGGDGRDSYLEYGPQNTFIARGGAGGSLCYESGPGKGGLYWNKGGDGVEEHQNGNDGSSGDGNNGGRGGTFKPEYTHSAGGSGGGALDFNKFITYTDSTGKPVTVKAVSKGGDGSTYVGEEFRKATNGYLGGGGGSSPDTGGDGGDGGALVVFFR